MSTVQMVVMDARIRSVSVVKTHRLKMKIICKNVWKKKVLIWVNASLIVMTINPAKNHVLIHSKNGMASVHVR